VTTPGRQHPSIFPDTTDGLLHKAQTLTRLCPNKEEWTCIMGFVDYKLVPANAPMREDVLDPFMLWLTGIHRQLETRGVCDDEFEGVSADQVAGLIRLVAERMESHE